MRFLLIVWMASLLLSLPNFVYSQFLREFFSNGAELNRDDLPELQEDIEELSKQVAIVSKENELQDIQLEEIKLQGKNPLGG